MAPTVQAPSFHGFPSQLHTPTFADITLVVGTCFARIPAHRIILSEYSTFFRYSCSDVTVPEVSIPQWEPQVIHFVLRYLYLGKLEKLDFDTMMTLLECAEDLGIDCLMEWILYTTLFEEGRYQDLMQDKVTLEKFIKKILKLTTEEGRESTVYKNIFKLLLALVHQNDLMKEDWFVNILKEHRDLGVEMLKALYDDGKITCFTLECREVVGTWNKCRICSDDGWGGDMDEW